LSCRVSRCYTVGTPHLGVRDEAERRRRAELVDEVVVVAVEPLLHLQRRQVDAVALVPARRREHGVERRQARRLVLLRQRIEPAGDVVRAVVEREVVGRDDIDTRVRDRLEVVEPDLLRRREQLLSRGLWGSVSERSEDSGHSVAAEQAD